MSERDLQRFIVLFVALTVGSVGALHLTNVIRSATLSAGVIMGGIAVIAFHLGLQYRDIRRT